MQRRKLTKEDFRIVEHEDGRFTIERRIIITSHIINKTKERWVAISKDDEVMNGINYVPSHIYPSLLVCTEVINTILNKQEEKVKYHYLK